MSMMMRRSAVGHEYAQEQRIDPALDPCFPEATGVTPQEATSAALYATIDQLAAQRFNGYVQVGGANALVETGGIVLMRDGAILAARAINTDGPQALAQLLTGQDTGPVLCAAHPLNEKLASALVATFHAPQLTQPMGGDSTEVALLLRQLTGVRHSGVVHVGARGPRANTPLWVRILLFNGEILGVYSAQDRYPKASLAEVTTVLAATNPQLSLYALPQTLTPLPLPRRVIASKPTEPAQTPNTVANPARDEALETDLIWFMSRFERAFGRLKERRDPQGDLLRAFGELTNELAGFAAGIPGEMASPAAARMMVEAEIKRAQAGGNAMAEMKLGKAGLDAVAIARGYSSLQRRSGSAATYFRSASNDMLTLMGRLMERMIAAFHDPVAAGLSREAGETLLREIRDGLGQLA